MPVRPNPPSAADSVANGGAEVSPVVLPDRSAHSGPSSGRDRPTRDDNFTEGPGKRHPVSPPGGHAAIFDGFLLALSRPKPG
eukprot:4282601-Alexandrium_andersonii.AAC.1